jgi:uncharacterized phage protein (TIGR02218 family)
MIENTVTTLATCWRLRLRSGLEMGFTDHDQELNILGMVYHSKCGFTPNQLDNQSNSSAASIDISGVLDHEMIKEEDLTYGLYDHAEIEVFLVDYTQPENEKIVLKHGFFSEISLQGNKFTATVHGLANKLEQQIGSVFSPLCRTEFCDVKCGLDKSKFTVKAVVAKVISKLKFEVEMESCDFNFAHGLLLIESGRNKGLKREVLSCEEGVVTILTQFPMPLEAGDECIMTAGCDKTFTTCRKIYNNAVNFRGEPHIPGVKKLVKI